MVERVCKCKYRPESEQGKNNIELNMYAVNFTNKSDANTGYKTPEGYDNKDWSKEQQILFKYFLSSMYLQHGQPKFGTTIESNYNSKICQKFSGEKIQFNEAPCEVALQNQKHIFFSPVVTGYEVTNLYSNSHRYNHFTFISNMDFFELPLINMSTEMQDRIGMPCYTGKPIDCPTYVLSFRISRYA